MSALISETVVSLCGSGDVTVGLLSSGFLVSFVAVGAGSALPEDIAAAAAAAAGSEKNNAYCTKSTMSFYLQFNGFAGFSANQS